MRSSVTRCRALGGLAGLFLLIHGGSPLAAQAPERVVAGRVLDAKSRQPVAEAQVQVRGAGAAVFTDAAGTFRVVVPDGPLEVRARRIGYLPATRAVAAGEPADAIDILLVASPTELTPIVVTATRDERNIVDVPAAISVADSNVIKEGRNAGLHEVLRYAPGVQATSRYGLDDVKLSIRGSGIRSTFGVRGVAVVLDGVPITEPDGQTRLDMIELGAARQVEVLRGPASALYGGTAAGGAVNIISKSGAEARGLALTAQGGSFGFRKYDGAYGTPLAQGRGAVYASGTWTDSDGFRAHNENRIWRLNLRSDYSFTDRTGVALEASTSDLDMKIPGSLTLGEFEADPDAAAPNTLANDHGRVDQRWRAGARARHLFGGEGGAEASGYFFVGARDLDHPIFQVLSQDMDRVQGGARARLPLFAGGRVAVTTGGDFDRFAGNQKQYVNNGGEAGALTADADVTLPTVGLYAQAEGQLTDRLSLTAGLRWDRVRYDVHDLLDDAASYEQTWSELSPKGALTYRLNPTSSAYVSVARGFEPPTFTELRTTDPAQPFNAELDPQFLVNYEVGYKTVFRDRMFLDLALFRTDIEGEFIPTSIGGTTVFENAGDSRHVGFEAGVRAFVTDWADVVGSYTWSDFTLDQFTSQVVQPDGTRQEVDFSGNRLAGVPVHRLAAEFRTRPLPGVSAWVGGEWQSKVFVENGNADEGEVYVPGFGPTPPPPTAVPFTSVDAFALVHVGASWTSGPVTLRASVENLFDETYVGDVAVNAADGRFYGAGAGRYVALGMTVAALGGSR